MTVRVLIADDSLTMRGALSAVLSQDPRIAVVGLASDGEEAVTLAARLRPDVITMDVQMPRLDGLEATRRIMAEAPSRILVVCSVNPADVNLSLRAVSAGALELIPKPRSASESLSDWGARVAESVRLMAEIPVVTRRPSHAPAHHEARPASGSGQVACWGIVASTGGPPAVARVLRSLAPDFRVPVLIAQHIAPGFIQGLAKWLGETAAREVVIAAGGEQPEPGLAYLAPDLHDLSLAGDRLHVSPSRGGNCPSGDALLRSIAATHGRSAGGVVLTGMGDDGAKGLLAIHQAGGVTIAQDEASSVVFGMPQVAKNLGAVDAGTPLEFIGDAMMRA